MLAALLANQIAVPVPVTGSGVERLRQHRAGSSGLWIESEANVLGIDDEEVAEMLALLIMDDSI